MYIRLLAPVNSIQAIMFKLLLVSALLVLASAAPRNVRRPPMPDGRIVGGTQTTIEDHPHQISLLYSGSHICGGSLVKENKVVTAAHCTDGSSASSLSIRYGSSIRNQGGTVVAVSNIAQNPQYDDSIIDYDSSVLTLSSNVVWADSAQPIALGASTPASGVNSICTGWGTTSEGGSSANNLMEVNLPIVSWQDCNEAYSNMGWEVTDRMICAGIPAGGIDACQGDSGGPLIVGSVGARELVGIVSWGYGCARPNYPGVYGSVSGMYDYINTQVNN